jgi:26 proteasome complex subunit DSS1
MSAAPPPTAAPKINQADKPSDPTKEVKPAAALEEDDEFEDFPVEGMPLSFHFQALS